MRWRKRLVDAVKTAGARAELLGCGEACSFLATVQPVDRLAREEAGPLGVGRRRHAVLYAPFTREADRLEEDSRLAWCGQVYRVLQRELFCFGGEPLYLWAVLEREGEAGDA